MFGSIAGDIVGSVYEYDNIKKRISRCLGVTATLQMIPL